MLDCMGMWVADDGTNAGICKAGVSKACEMFHAVSPLVLNSSAMLVHIFADRCVGFSGMGMLGNNTK